MPFIILTSLIFVALLAFAFWSKRTYARRRGDWTESKVAKQLAKLPKDEYIVLNDLMLPTSYGTTQIDHVVLSLYGVYVIETKNYTGTLIGNEKSEQCHSGRQIWTVLWVQQLSKCDFNVKSLRTDYEDINDERRLGRRFYRRKRYW